MFISVFPFVAVQFHVLTFQPFPLAPWPHSSFPRYPNTASQVMEGVRQPAHLPLSNPLFLPPLIDEQEPHPKIQEEYSSHY